MADLRTAAIAGTAFLLGAAAVILGGKLLGDEAPVRVRGGTKIDIVAGAEYKWKKDASNYWHHESSYVSTESELHVHVEGATCPKGNSTKGDSLTFTLNNGKRVTMSRLAYSVGLYETVVYDPDSLFTVGSSDMVLTYNAAAFVKRVESNQNGWNCDFSNATVDDRICVSSSEPQSKECYP
jgi:hypothetical protein